VIDIDWEWLASLPFLKEVKYYIKTISEDWKTFNLETKDFGTVEILFDSEEQLTKEYIEMIYFKIIKERSLALSKCYLKIAKSLEVKE